MLDALIIIFKLQEFGWYQVIEAGNHAPGPPEQTLNFILIRHWLISRDIEEWLICKCNWSRAFSYVRSKLIGYAYTFLWRLPAPRKWDINAFKRYWRLKNTQDGLVESICGDVYQTYSNFTNSARSSYCCLPRY